MKIALLGDIALFGAYSITNNKHLLDNLSEISDYLSKFDCVVGNLETPFSIRKKTHGAKSAYICSDAENVEVLKKLNVTAVCLSNNHMFDFGEEGFECTMEILAKAGISYFGVDGVAWPFKMEGNRIMFSGFCCYSSNPLHVAKKYGNHGVNCYNVNTVSRIISEYDAQNYLNIVAVHAGTEHVNYPSTDHIKAARKLAEAAPFVYYGHHPHVIQGVEDYNGSLIAHSLGNFCFDDVYTSASETPLVELTENNRTGMILELDVEYNRISSWKGTIIHIGKDGRISVLKEQPACITEYNRRLKNSLFLADYDTERQTIINKRLSDRREMRNLRWYLIRIRPRYFKLILNAKMNLNNYNKNVKQFI